MKATEFIDAFGHIAEAPGGASELRRLVVNFACRGRLAPQHQEDEPAIHLLARIREQRAVRLAQKSISKPPVIPSRGIANGPSITRVPEGWHSALLGEFILLEYGKSLPKEARSPEGPVPVMGANGELGRCDRPLLAEPVVVVGRKGSAGATNLVWEPSWPTDVTYFIRRISDEDLEFVLLLLRSLDLPLLGRGIKPGLDRNEAHALPVCIPPALEQRRIVDRAHELLALCDELEESHRRAAAHRVATARSALAAIVESDRGDADRAVRLVEEHVRQCLAPGEGALEVLGQVRGAVLDLAVRGRLLPAAREQESALDSPGGMHRPDVPASARTERGTAASDSHAGTQAPFSAPAGWAWTTIGDVADIENGDRGRNYPSKHTLVEAGVPFVNAGHLAGGRVQIDRADFITEEHFSRLARGRFKRGDVLFCLRGSLGKCGLVDVEAEGAIASSLVILRPTGLILARYLLIFLESHAGRAEVSAYNNGTAQPNLASKDLARFRIPVPPLEVQQQVVDRVDELTALSDRLGAALESERALASSLAESVCAAAARSM